MERWHCNVHNVKKNIIIYKKKSKTRMLVVNTECEKMIVLEQNQQRKGIEKQRRNISNNK